MTEPLAIEFIDLSEADARKIWHKQAKRAANFDKFLMTLNARSIGAAFDLAIAKISGADKSEEYAKEVKHNFNEAAKERVRIVTVDAAPPENVEINGAPGSAFAQSSDGKWRAEVADPVVIRWKASSHSEKRTVQDGKIKKEIEITVVDFLHGLIVASDTVKKRGPRATASEQVDALVAAALNPPVDAKTVILTDGRTATKTKAGHWRAPKPPNANGGESSSQSHSTASESTNDDNSVRDNGQTAETPVGAA